MFEFELLFRCLKRAYRCRKCGNTQWHRVSLIRAPVPVARVCTVKTLRTSDAWLRTPIPSLPLTPCNRPVESLLLKTITLILCLVLLLTLTQVCTLLNPFELIQAMEPGLPIPRAKCPIAIVLVARVRNLSLLRHLPAPCLPRARATRFIKIVALVRVLETINLPT